MCKSHISLKFQVLREGSSVIVSFVEHPVYSIFKMYSVPILVFLFWFTTVNPKCCVKVTLWKCQVLHKGSSDIASFVEHPVNSIFKRYSVLTLVFLFWFPILTQIVCLFFLKFQVLREGSSVIAAFVEHPACSNFKMYNFLICHY